jgi:hypothetical protein
MLTNAGPLCVGNCEAGRNWVRTSDPSLVRCVRTVAERRLAWPDMASSCDDCGWTWPGDPSRLRTLALSLALCLVLDQRRSTQEAEGTGIIQSDSLG